MSGNPGVRAVGPLIVVCVGLSLLIASLGAIAIGYLRQRGVLQVEDRWPLWVSGVMGVLGVLLASHGSKKLVKIRDQLNLKAKLMKQGKTAMGNVVSLTPHFIYEFPLPSGRKIQGISESGNDSDYVGLFLGSAIEIIYNPANPEESVWSGR